MGLMELQSEYITQIAVYLHKKNVGSYRYALVANEERLRTWTLSLREGQAKHPAAVPSCQSYHKVNFCAFDLHGNKTDNFLNYSRKMGKFTSTHTSSQIISHLSKRSTLTEIGYFCPGGVVTLSLRL